VSTPRIVAVVEDEAALRENYADALKRRGYRVQVFAGRKEAMASFQSRLPDLVVIDINLGDEVDGGFELCRELRARSASLPIIFLTARDSELDAVSGLRLGADDYLTKNISLDHLLARVSALFRRVDALAQSNPAFP
jgi:two-component system OmpR family response regulator